MDVTPKLKKKTSLSLGSRLNSKRRNDSPQSCSRFAQSPGGCNSKEGNAIPPSCSTGGTIECTPPPKKYSLNDSIDCSPQDLDTSFSPSCQPSQTLPIDSPEVNWRWGLETNSFRKNFAVKTPNSVNVLDRNSNSVVSPSLERIGITTRKRLASDIRREEQRKAADLQLRRADKARADELLRKRCASLQKQLDEAGKQILQEKEHKGTHVKASITSAPPSKKDTTSASASSWLIASKVDKVSEKYKFESLTSNDTLDNFLNDSDSDCLLLEATQQLESKIVQLTQKPTHVVATTKMPSTAPAATTPTSSSKTERSSFYMKFLEDDLGDDWFASIDEVVLLETQAKKPRASFHRYNSMPVGTAAAGSSVAEGSALTTKTTRMRSNDDEEGASVVSESVTKMKRHASSHSLSPSSSNCPRRQLHLRK